MGSCWAKSRGLKVKLKRMRTWSSRAVTFLFSFLPLDSASGLLRPWLGIDRYCSAMIQTAKVFNLVFAFHSCYFFFFLLSPFTIWAAVFLGFNRIFETTFKWSLQFRRFWCSVLRWKNITCNYTTWVVIFRLLLLILGPHRLNCNHNLNKATMMALHWNIL